MREEVKGNSTEEVYLVKECRLLLWDIDRRQPGGRGRHHLTVKLKNKLEYLRQIRADQVVHSRRRATGISGETQTPHIASGE